MKLSFCREPDEKSMFNFVPFIYQEKDNTENNKFMIYDLLNNTFPYI